MIEGIRGRMEFILEIVPRFDYGTTKAWIRSYKEDHCIAMGGSDGLLISSDLCPQMRHRHFISGSCTAEEGQRTRLSILYRRPEDLDEGLVEVPSFEELDRRLEETVAWWRSWSARATVRGPHAGHARRSVIVLKGLCNAPTGAIAAAPTTSLPESPGGMRNWDYRYTWIRDSCFTVRSLAEVGHVQEAEGFPSIYRAVCSRQRR